MTEPAKDKHKPVLQHKYSMDATLKRSIPVVEAESEVGQSTFDLRSKADGGVLVGRYYAERNRVAYWGWGATAFQCVLVLVLCSNPSSFLVTVNYRMEALNTSDRCRPTLHVCDR